MNRGRAEFTVVRGEAVGELGERRRNAARGPHERGGAPAAGEVRHGAQLRNAEHLVVVERRADPGDRADRQLRIRGGGEQREHAADGPADEIDRRTAAIGAHAQDRLGQDVGDPVLEAHSAIGEGDLAVVDQVGRAAGLHQIPRQALIATQVEAGGGRGQRRHQQHRGIACRRLEFGIVATQQAVRLVPQHGRGRRVDGLDTRAEAQGPRVARGGGDGVGDTHD